MHSTGELARGFHRDRQREPLAVAPQPANKKLSPSFSRSVESSAAASLFVRTPNKCCWPLDSWKHKLIANERLIEWSGLKFAEVRRLPRSLVPLTPKSSSLERRPCTTAALHTVWVSTLASSSELAGELALPFAALTICRRPRISLAATCGFDKPVFHPANSNPLLDGAPVRTKPQLAVKLKQHSDKR